MAFGGYVYQSIFQLVVICILQHTTDVTGVNTTSRRMIYYLYTVPRTWNEAKILCNNQDATLLLLKNEERKKQLRYLDEISEWKGAFTTMLTAESFWIGLYEDNATYYWEGCNPLGNWSFWSAVTSQPGDMCVSIDINFSGMSSPCHTKRNFICQRDEGECWFDPVPYNTTSDGITSDKINVTDEADCAKRCRSGFKYGAECWAFSFNYVTSDCYLHFHNDSLAYIRPSRVLNPDQNMIFYTKMCLDGITRVDNRSLSQDSTTPLMSSCNGVIPSDDSVHDTDVCYCGCEAPPTIFDPELEALTIDDKVEAIHKELTVDTKNISSSVRKLVSATDNRPSAVSIGYVGVFFMALVFGGIVLLDMNVLVSAIRDLYRSFTSKSDDMSWKESKM
ncbi:hypothetical protein SNE40_002725 [Patella caerulea]|uniref:C-type lectin domain-containing protein n=1 Tax=Patella caerulea TaxID=87958 RepID=A0AAN8Q411_PATCE